MLTCDAVTQEALALPQRDRAALAAVLLGSLPPVLHEEDDGVAEALRREAEMDANPSVCLTHADFVAGIKAQRGR